MHGFSSKYWRSRGVGCEQYVFPVVLRRHLSEVEAAGDPAVVIVHRRLIMGNGAEVVDPYRYLVIYEAVAPLYRLDLLTLSSVAPHRGRRQGSLQWDIKIRENAALHGPSKLPLSGFVTV
jgi:hypothetical protein